MAHSKNDLRFNRINKRGRRIYLSDYENGRIAGDESYGGYIKCKLVHNRHYSLLLPDQVYVDLNGKTLWFQPLFYSANLISNYGTHGTCKISIDVSHCIVLDISFKNCDVIHRLDDCSLVYRCEIKAPKNLYRYATGRANMGRNGPRLQLYHHTNKEAKESILAGGEYRTSNWNIRGTKKLINISYLYLTSLPVIEMDEDLGVIAMSSDGRLGFRTDLNYSGMPDLILTVYRESTTERTEVLSHWVDATSLATQPVYRHCDLGGFKYYEVVCPFVHRIGAEPGTTVAISDDCITPHSAKNFGYAIVGDATTKTGLAAPYDEEQTHAIFKIECLAGGVDIIDYWIANANTDKFSSKMVETAELI